MFATFNFDGIQFVLKLIEMLRYQSIFICFAFQCRGNETKTEDIPSTTTLCWMALKKLNLLFIAITATKTSTIIANTNIIDFILLNCSNSTIIRINECFLCLYGITEINNNLIATQLSLVASNGWKKKNFFRIFEFNASN